MSRALLAVAILALLSACTAFKGPRSLAVTNAGDAPLRLTWRQAWTNVGPAAPEPDAAAMRLAPGETATITYEPGDRLSVYTEDFTGPTDTTPAGARAAIKLDGSFTVLEARAAGGTIDLITD